MTRTALVAIGTFLTSVLPASAQQDYGPWRMHEWGWGGMWFGPLLMLAVIVLFVALVVLLVRWLGGERGLSSAATRTAREVLDERYARGEIDREDYLKRRQDISGI
jgi:putative membrane protein